MKRPGEEICAKRWHWTICRHATMVSAGSHGVNHAGLQAFHDLRLWIFFYSISLGFSHRRPLLISTPHSLSTLRCGILDLRVRPTLPGLFMITMIYDYMIMITGF